MIGSHAAAGFTLLICVWRIVRWISPREPTFCGVLVGDPGALSQVLINPIGNAIRFTDHGQVTISAWTELEEGMQILLHVCVADTGVGIPEAKQSSVFDAFVQADGSSTRRHGGTGLGLAISANLVKLMAAGSG